MSTKHIVIDSQNEDFQLRLSLDVGSKCLIFSRSQRRWYPGMIANIYIDTKTNQEWFKVKYGNNKTKKMQRFCEYLDVMNDIDPFTVRGWTQLSSLEFNSETCNYSNIIAINNELFIATEMNRLSLGNMHGLTFGGIYKYNIVRNKWCIFIKYPSNLPLLSDTKPHLSYNAEMNELYLFGLHHEQTYGKRNVLIKIHMISKKAKIIEISRLNSIKESDLMNSCIVIQNKFHFVGGEHNKSTAHQVLDLTTDRFEKNTVIWPESVRLSGLAYINSLQRTLHIFVYTT